MPTPAIIDRVKELQAELDATRPHPAAAEDLEGLKQQIATVLLEPAHVPHYASLGDKLRNSSVGLELHHPKLARLVEGVSNALTAAGL